MNSIYSITSSSSYKRLSFQHYEYIIREITKHNAFHTTKKRNTGRTALIRKLTSIFHTSDINFYL